MASIFTRCSRARSYSNLSCLSAYSCISSRTEGSSFQSFAQAADLDGASYLSHAVGSIKKKASVFYQTSVLDSYRYVSLFLRVGLDILGSFALHITIAFFALCWGLMQILLARLNMLPPTIRKILGHWDFGQILPLIILLTPLYGVVEHFSSHSAHGSQAGGEVQDITDENGKPDESQYAGSPEEIPASTSPFHWNPERVYSISLFNVIVGLLSITVVGAGIGLYAESIVAYTGPSRPLTWTTMDWHLLPDIIFTATAFAFIFLLSIFWRFILSKDIS